MMQIVQEAYSYIFNIIEIQGGGGYQSPFSLILKLLWQYSSKGAIILL